jgi:hypothetical protein
MTKATINTVNIAQSRASGSSNKDTEKICQSFGLKYYNNPPYINNKNPLVVID